MLAARAHAANTLHAERTVSDSRGYDELKSQSLTPFRLMALKPRNDALPDVVSCADILLGGESFLMTIKCKEATLASEELSLLRRIWIRIPPFHARSRPKNLETLVWPSWSPSKGVVNSNTISKQIADTNAQELSSDMSSFPCFFSEHGP